MTPEIERLARLIAVYSGDTVLISIADHSHRIEDVQDYLTARFPKLMIIEQRPEPSIGYADYGLKALAALISSKFTYPIFDLPRIWAGIRLGFQSFLRTLAPHNLEPNPLPILMRAVNLRVILQPCWYHERWKGVA